MAQQPSLESERLLLRPFNLSDAPAVHEIVSEREIASNTSRIPHPYEEGLAEEWIGLRQKIFDRKEEICFAIVCRSDNRLIGSISLRPDEENFKAELGYLVAKPRWGQGYCTEAARAVLRYGFQELKLNRIYAYHMMRNPASGRVLQKIGMQHEGTLRQFIYKWGQFEDMAVYSILRNEYQTE